MKSSKPIPFDFVIEQLYSAEPVIKPMFGCHAIYIQQKIVLILRKKDEGKRDNGVWVATTPEHHASLKKDFPSMRSIRIFGEGESGWQLLPYDADDFEESAIKACSFILRNDPRIGKIPKSKKKKSAS